MSLKDIEFNKYYVIKNINTNIEVKRRLQDIGMIDGTKIKLLYISPSKKIKAYLIRNSIIAIRDSDAIKILVGDFND